MPVPVLYLLVAIGAYLLGSIPTGYLVARARGIDIRSVGSGNIGATNAMRVLGKPAGITVLLFDALKGYGGVWLGHWILASANAQPGDVATARVLGGLFAVLGHNYTCWLKFKGGKGIATTAGAYLALAPEAVLIAIVAFVLAVLITRYVSIGSLVAAVTLPTAVWFTRENTLLRTVTIALGLLAIYKHRANIQRLLAGTESRIGQKSQDLPSKSPPSSNLRTLGIVLLVAGLLIAGYYFVFFDSSVQNGAERVVNFGLMADRQNGIIIGIGTGIIGAIMFAVRSRSQS